MIAEELHVLLQSQNLIIQTYELLSLLLHEEWALGNLQLHLLFLLIVNYLLSSHVILGLLERVLATLLQFELVVGKSGRLLDSASESDLLEVSDLVFKLLFFLIVQFLVLVLSSEGYHSFVLLRSRRVNWLLLDQVLIQTNRSRSLLLCRFCGVDELIVVVEMPSERRIVLWLVEIEGFGDS